MMEFDALRFNDRLIWEEVMRKWDVWQLGMPKMHNQDFQNLGITMTILISERLKIALHQFLLHLLIQKKIWEGRRHLNFSQGILDLQT